MTSYNVKCKGCGTYLNSDINSLGYVPKYIQNKTIYCQRCFRLINYGDYECKKKEQTHIIQNLEQLNLKQYIIYLVVDAFDLYNSLIIQFRKYKNLVIVVNKMDLFKPYKNNETIKQKIINNIINVGFYPENIIFCSVNENMGMNNLLNCLKHAHKQKYKNIFIGISNVGKSSIINKLAIINKNNLQKNTISSHLNTTRDFIKTTINKITIIDTPGYINEKSILNNINLKQIKQVNVNKINKIRNYQIHYNKTISIENLISFDIFIDENQPGHIKFMINENLKINSFKKIKIDPFNQPNQIKNNEHLLKKQITFNFDKPDINLVVSSLGIVSCHNIKSITINFYNEIGIYELIEPIIT